MNNNNILFIKNKENILFSIKNNNILFSSKQRILLMDIMTMFCLLIKKYFV